LAILNRLNKYLLLMGIPGLFVIAFLDSAAAPLSGGPDAVVLLLSWERPALAIVIAAAGALGSTLGCLVLYSIGQRSGERALARFSPTKRDWAERNMAKHGVWAVIAGVLAPPPFPTKLLVLAAGVLKTGKAKFSGAVLAGRLLRYSLVAYLGAHFGARAGSVLKANYAFIVAGLIGCILLIYLVRALRNSGRSPEGEVVPPPQQ